MTDTVLSTILPRRKWSVAIVLCLLMVYPPPALAIGPPITQHRINEIAATAEAAHDMLAAMAGPRAPAEPLQAYVKRGLPPQTGETLERRNARVNGCIKALEHAVAVSAAVRSVPALSDGSSANHMVWQRVARSATALSARARQLVSLWRSAGVASRAVSPPVADDFVQSIQLLDELDSALRDALP